LHGGKLTRLRREAKRDHRRRILQNGRGGEI
jgi:hypothetical protein